MSKEGINVCIRARPFIEREIRAGEDKLGADNWIVDSHNNTIQSTHEGKRPFNFDRVYDPFNSNEDVYSESALPIVKSALLGVNGTILAYGQTSSGKTYTMSSIMKQSFAYIYDHIKDDTKRQYVVKAGYCEVYNESITDLASQLTNLAVTDTGAIKNLTIKDMPTANDLLNFHGDGTKNRKVGATKMNAESSRSHSIFQVYIESFPIDDGPKSTLPINTKQQSTSGKLLATINFVDLAGSERASQTEASGDRLKEGAQINTSLLVLGRVIRALTRNETPPYRESKLTRILRPSLGGNCRTTLICCITLAKRNTPETASTLGFAFAAKQVINTVGVNEILDDKQMVLRLRETVNVYRNTLSRAHDFVADLNRRGVPVTPDVVASLLSSLNIPATTAIGTLLSATTPAAGGNPQKKFSAASTRDSLFSSGPQLKPVDTAGNKSSDIDLSDLEKQQADLEGEFTQMGGKKAKLVIDTNPVNNKLVQLASFYTPGPAIDTIVQTDFSVMASLQTPSSPSSFIASLKQGRKSKKRKSMAPTNPSVNGSDNDDMNDHDDDCEDNSPVHFYPNGGKTLVANTAKMAELLGFSVGDELLNEYIPQDESTISSIEESITDMLKSHGFDDVQQYISQIQGHQEEIALLQSDLLKLRAQYDSIEQQLGSEIEVLKDAHRREMEARDAIIDQLQNDLNGIKHINSDVFQQQKLDIDEYEIKLSAISQEYELLKMQHANANTKHAEALKYQQTQSEHRQQELMNEIALYQKTVGHNKKELDTAVEQYEAEIADITADYQNKIKLLEAEHEDELKLIGERHSTQTKKAEQEYEKKYAMYKGQREELLKELQDLESHMAGEEKYYETEYSRLEEEFNTKLKILAEKADGYKEKYAEALANVNELRRENERQALRIQQLTDTQEKELEQNSHRLKAISGDKDKIINSLEQQLSIIKTTLMDQRVAFETLQQRLTTSDQELNQERKLRLSVEDQLKKKQESYDALKKRLDEWVSKHREQADANVKKVTQSLSAERDRYKGKVEEKDQYIKHLKELQVQFKDKVQQKIAETRQECEELNKKLRVKEKEKMKDMNDLETKQIKLAQCEKDLLTYRNEHRILSESVESLKIQLGDSTAKNQYYANEVQVLRGKLSNNDNKYGQHMADIEKARQREQREYLQRIQLLEQEKGTAEKQAAIWKQQQQEAMNKLTQMIARNADLESDNQTYQNRLQQSSLMNTGVNIYGNYGSGTASIPSHLRREHQQQQYGNDEDTNNIFAHSQQPSAAMMNNAMALSSPFKRMNVHNPPSVASLMAPSIIDSNPGVVKFVGGAMRTKSGRPATTTSTASTRRARDPTDQ